MSKTRDRQIGIKRLKNLVARTGKEAGVALIYDLASNELIAKFYEGTELMLEQAKQESETTTSGEQKKWQEVASLVSNLFKLIKSVRYYLVGTVDAMEDSQKVLEESITEEQTILLTQVEELKERHQEIVLVIENLQAAEKERKPLEKLFTELSA